VSGASPAAAIFAVAFERAAPRPNARRVQECLPELSTVIVWTRGKNRCRCGSAEAGQPQKRLCAVRDHMDMHVLKLLVGDRALSFKWTELHTKRTGSGSCDMAICSAGTAFVFTRRRTEADSRSPASVPSLCRAT